MAVGLQNHPGNLVKDDPGARSLAPLATGWAVITHFGRGGTRWTGRGPRLRVVAINSERGSGSSVAARLELVRSSISRIEPIEPTLYFTPAGFFGCHAGRGDRIRGVGGLSWPGVPDAQALSAAIGRLSRRLPSSAMLAVGVDGAHAHASQEQWWFRGGDAGPTACVARNEPDVDKRTFLLGTFRVRSFVCGELWDGGSCFEVGRDTQGIDVVIDLAHASVSRLRARTVRPERRHAFQRRFFDLSGYCGAMLAHAHDVDVQRGYVRRQDNWIVFRGEPPFPDDAHEVIRLGASVG